MIRELHIGGAQEQVYRNSGNTALIDLTGKHCSRVLDVGCGADDNAALLKSKYPECEVFGITHSIAEAEIAKPHMAHCWVIDIEQELPIDLSKSVICCLVSVHCCAVATMC